MEKPPLEKIIARLEGLDAREWKGKIHEPFTLERYEEFIANINDLVFSIYLLRKNREFKKDLYYPCLSITNKEMTIGIEYKNHKTDSIEAKEIGRLHKKIKDYYFSSNYKEKQKEEFKEKLDTFLSD